MKHAKTYSAKPTEVARQWYLVDASQATLGRVASAVAQKLIGKHKPSYTPHIDVGDSVVVINAAKLKVSGNKLTQKQYYRHSGYPGGIKSLSLEEQLAKDSTEVINHAVKGMLPKNKLQATRMLRLRVYATDSYKETAQKPIELKLDNQKGKE